MEGSLKRLFAPTRGVTMVEFALAAPVALFLMISFVQLGLVLSAYVSVTNVAREAARSAIVSGLNDGERVSAAREAVFPGNDCTSLRAGLAHVTGSIACTGGVTVQVRTPAGIYVALPAAQSVEEAMDFPSRRGQTLRANVDWTVTMDLAVFVPTPDFTVTATSSMRIE